MNKQERDKAVASLKEICREIGCSGLNPAMCDSAPQMCGIIRKLVIPSNKRLHTDAGESTVKIGSLTPEEDAAIKADNKPAQRG